MKTYGTTVFSMEGIKRGMLMTIPLGIGAFAFGGAFGALAAQKAMSWLEALFMSLFVFAGASQMVALDMWIHPLPTLTMVVVIGIVNSRMILESASIYPWLKEMPAPARRVKLLASIFSITDGSWALAMERRADGETDLGVFLGSSLFLYLIWMISTLLGYFLGTLIENPETFGIDMVLPAFFTVMLVPLCRQATHIAPIIVSLIFAVVLSQLMDGYGYLVISALAGCATAIVLYKEEDKDDGGQT